MAIKRIFAYAATYLLWGGAYLAVRVLVQEIPSFFAAGLRYLLAAVCICPFLFLPGVLLPSRRQVLNAVWTGLLLLVAGYGVVFWAEQRLPSWMVAVLLSTAFLWTYLAESLILRSHRFRAAMLVPLLVGLAGMPFVVGGASQRAGISIIPALGVLLGALCWSAGSVSVKWAEMPKSTLCTLALQLASSGVLLFCISAAVGEWRHLPAMGRIVAWRPALAMAYLVVGASLLGFASFHWLLKHEPASLVATSSYVNPIVALILGIAAAHERISSIQMIGAIAVMGSIIAIWYLQPLGSGLEIMSAAPSPEFEAELANELCA